MLNIASDVRTYITANLPTLFAALGIDAFGVAPEALIVRSDPSQAVVTEYIDGSTTGIQALSFYARSKSPAVALGALDAIRVLLDQPEIALTSALCIRVQPRALSALVGKEETGESIYVMSVDVSFDGQNGR